ncbi:MAG: hypothetical protein ABIJ21_05645 [Nanoarchaeota archaeon]
MSLESAIKDVQEVMGHARTAISDAIHAEDIYQATDEIERYLSLAIQSRNKETRLPEGHALKDRYNPKDAKEVLLGKILDMTGPEPKAVRKLWAEGSDKYRPLSEQLGKVNKLLTTLDVPALDEESVISSIVDIHASRLKGAYEENLATIQDNLQQPRTFSLQTIQTLSKSMEDYLSFTQKHGLDAITPKDAAFPLNYGLRFMDAMAKNIPENQSIIVLYASVRQATLAYAAFFPTINKESLTTLITSLDNQILAHELTLLAKYADPANYQLALTDAAREMYGTIIPLLRSIATSEDAICELDRIDMAYRTIIREKEAEFLAKQDELYDTAIASAETGNEDQKNKAQHAFEQFSRTYSCILDEDAIDLQRAKETIDTAFRKAYHCNQKEKQDTY